MLKRLCLDFVSKLVKHRYNLDVSLDMCSRIYTTWDMYIYTSCEIFSKYPRKIHSQPAFRKVSINTQGSSFLRIICDFCEILEKKTNIVICGLENPRIDTDTSEKSTLLIIL